MPKYESTLLLESVDIPKTLSTCYAAFEQLNWIIKSADEDRLTAYTPKTGLSNSMEVTALATLNQLSVTSQMVQNESFDLMKKNKKNVETFFIAFQEQQEKITTEAINNNKERIDVLRAETIKLVEEEVKELVELQEAMNIGNASLTVTYAIIGINVLIFILMAMQGAGIFDANGLVHLKWGSNYGPLTKSGDWWRLFTAMFIHFGIIHLGLNMYALYSIGTYLEPMLGKTRYIVGYICTGIFASLVSLWWHTEPANSAGASGAVFGMYGLFLALLTTNLIPKKVRNQLLQGIVVFVIYNLIYGLKGGIDNAAHVGGLVSGLLIGYLFGFAIKREKAERPAQWLLPLIVIVCAASSYIYLQQNKSPVGERQSILLELKNAEFPDTDLFKAKYTRFIYLQDESIKVFNDYEFKPEELPKALREQALPKWDEAESIAQQLQKMNVSEEMHQIANAVMEYIQLRKKEIEVQSALAVNSSDSLIKQQQELVDQINRVVEKLK